MAGVRVRERFRFEPTVNNENKIRVVFSVVYNIYTR
jgi:hypothetical protein